MASQIPSNNPSRALLARAHSPATTDRIYTEKIQHKPLFLRPSSPDLSDARTQRQQARATKKAAQRKSTKPRPLSAKQKRVLGVYEIPAEQRKYDIFVPLWRMWCGYAREILGAKATGEDGQFSAFVTPAGAGPLLGSADFHGAELLVVRSRCVGRVGTRGIVVRDTRFTFDIITPKDELKTIPKEHTIFRVEVPLVELERPQPSITLAAAPVDRPPSLVFELHGDRFIARAPDRATRKIGLHIAKDI